MSVRHHFPWPYGLGVKLPRAPESPRIARARRQAHEQYTTQSGRKQILERFFSAGCGNEFGGARLSAAGLLTRRVGRFMGIGAGVRPRTYAILRRHRGQFGFGAIGGPPARPRRISNPESRPWASACCFGTSFVSLSLVSCPWSLGLPASGAGVWLLAFQSAIRTPQSAMLFPVPPHL